MKTYIYAIIHVYMYMCLCVETYMYIYTYVRSLKPFCLKAQTYAVRLYIYTLIRSYIYVQIHIHIFIDVMSPALVLKPVLKYRFRYSVIWGARSWNVVSRFVDCLFTSRSCFDFQVRGHLFWCCIGSVLTQFHLADCAARVKLETQIRSQ